MKALALLALGYALGLTTVGVLLGRLLRRPSFA